MTKRKYFKPTLRGYNFERPTPKNVKSGDLLVSGNLSCLRSRLPLLTPIEKLDESKYPTP